MTASCPTSPNRSAARPSPDGRRQPRPAQRTPASSITWPTVTPSCSRVARRSASCRSTLPRSTATRSVTAARPLRSRSPSCRRVPACGSRPIRRSIREIATAARSRYVWKGSSLVNLRLVREGAAAPYFYSGDEGRYAAQIFQAAVAARKAGKGLWGHCRKGAVPLRATRGVATGPVHAPRKTVAGGALVELQPELHALRAEFRDRPELPAMSATRSRSSGPTRTTSTATATATAARATEPRGGFAARSRARGCPPPAARTARRAGSRGRACPGAASRPARRRWRARSSRRAARG